MKGWHQGGACVDGLPGGLTSVRGGCASKVPVPPRWLRLQGGCASKVAVPPRWLRLQGGWDPGLGLGLTMPPWRQRVCPTGTHVFTKGSPLTPGAAAVAATPAHAQRTGCCSCGDRGAAGCAPRFEERGLRRVRAGSPTAAGNPAKMTTGADHAAGGWRLPGPPVGSSWASKTRVLNLRARACGAGADELGRRPRVLSVLVLFAARRTLITSGGGAPADHCTPRRVEHSFSF
jgi:hypothetical protein